MTREEIETLDREDRINLLEAYVNGNIEIIGGEPFDMGPEALAMIIIRDCKEYLGMDFNRELPVGFRERFHGSIIVYPDNGRYEWTPKRTKKYGEL